MEDVDEKLQALIESMKKTPEYTNYCRLEEELKSRPALKKKIDEYRLKCYEMQTSNRDLYEETDYVIREYKDIIKDHLASAYLDAESGVCRMIQKAVDAINAEVSVELPK